jgi:hypothetical protein
MENKLIYVCCKIDQSGNEKKLGILTEKQIETRRWWDYTRKMLVPVEKLENLNIGNVDIYLDMYEIY